MSDGSKPEVAEVGDTPPGHAQWRKGVAGVLAKSRRVDVGDLPPEPETLLAVQTYDDITVSPLYTAGDELPEPGLPGTFPFVRGRDGHRDVNAGWLVSAKYTETDPAAVNRAILDGLGNGVSAIWLGVGELGVPVGGLSAALADVLLDLAPLTIDAGADVADAAQAIWAVLDERAAAGDGVTDRTKVTVSLGAAPLTGRFADKVDTDLAGAVALAAAAAGRAETIRAITVDGTVFHDAGASDSEEIGAAIAAGLDYLRAMTDAGMTAATAFTQLEFRYAATDDQFQAIAKFRAARRVWARVAQVCGASAQGGAPQHAVTSAPMMTQRDPWVNMLRTTLAAFGAGVGGADSVTVLPFDAAVPLGGLDISKTFAARIARNTQLLLLEESHLGRVLDPAAGSWYVESLTDAIAAKAWEFFQEIEASGGYTAALESGAIAERIAATRAGRDADIAHRKTSVTGINEFPNLDEKPLPADAPQRLAGVARYSAAFEALRDRSDVFLAANGTRPKVLLAALGSVAEHNGRTTFAANLLASGGIEAVNPGTVDADTVARAVADSGTDTAVLCGTDQRYADEGADAVAALRAAGVRTVLVAGPEKAFAEATHRPDGYLTLRIDAVSALSDLLDTLGAK